MRHWQWRQQPTEMDARVQVCNDAASGHSKEPSHMATPPSIEDLDYFLVNGEEGNAENIEGNADNIDDMDNSTMSYKSSFYNVTLCNPDLPYIGNGYLGDQIDICPFDKV